MAKIKTAVLTSEIDTATPAAIKEEAIKKAAENMKKLSNLIDSWGTVDPPPKKDLKAEFDAQAATKQFSMSIGLSADVAASPKTVAKSLEQLAAFIVKSANELGYSPFCQNDPEYGEMGKIVYQETDPSVPWHTNPSLAAEMNMKFTGKPEQFIAFMNKKMSEMWTQLDTAKKKYQYLAKQACEQQQEVKVQSPKEALSDEKKSVYEAAKDALFYGSSVSTVSWPELKLIKGPKKHIKMSETSDPTAVCDVGVIGCTLDHKPKMEKIKGPKQDVGETF